MDDDTIRSNLRTPLELALRVLTVHAVVTANYAHLCHLQQRSRYGLLYAARILLFIFVPMLCVAELVADFLLSLLKFIQNQADHEDVNVKFHAAGAIGMYAKAKKSTDSDKSMTVNMPLVHLDETAVSCETTKFSGPWVGQLLFTLFTLAQGIGTIVIWGRRLGFSEPECLGFDHRMGLMGIASTVISTICLLIFMQRSTWIIDSPLSPTFDVSLSRERSRLFIRAFMAISIQTLIEHFARKNNFLRVIRLQAPLKLLLQWQLIILFIFIYVFRREIIEKFGLQSVTGKLSGQVRPSSARRIKVLGWAILLLGFLTFIIASLVIDIVQCVAQNASEWGRQYYMWQDPWSDRLLVI